MPKDPNAEPDISGGDVTTNEPDISGGDVEPSPWMKAYTAVGAGYKEPFQQTANVVHDIVSAVSKPGGLAELQKKYPPVGNVGDVLKQAYGSLNPVVVKRDESGGIDYPATAGATVGNIGAMLTMGKLGEGIAGESGPSNAPKRLTEASGVSSKVDIPGSWEKALPKLKEAVEKHGSPENIPQLTGLVQQTLTDTQNEFGQRMIPLANQQVMPNRISQGILAELVPNPKTAEDRAWNANLRARAVEFQQPFTYGELDQQRMSAHDRLNPFYGKTESAQGAVTGTRADIAVDRIIEREARDTVYDALQNFWKGQVPDNYIRDLKQAQSSLISLKDQMMKREIQVKNMENAPLRERVRLHSYATPGHIGGAVGNVAELLFPEYKAAHQAAATPFTPTTNRLPQLLLSTTPNIVRNTEE